MKLLIIYIASTLICLLLGVKSVLYIINYESTSIWDDPSTSWYVLSGCSIIVVIILSIAIIDHLDSWLNRAYYFDKFLKKRDYYVLALQESRDKGREGETFKILENTVNWNLRLAERQVLYTHYLYNCYVDERILAIEPIK
ncbi:hypothetical protein [Flavobacterium sp.]|uniref:hypothetical protein n=1 Tax=Flavobacterium sp. TaxID=239 RepID=UPI002614D6DD|nr:hypothetical protein [Flavobacterium sp.]